MRFITLHKQLYSSQIRRKLLFVGVHSLVKFNFSLVILINALIKYSSANGLDSLNSFYFYMT